MPVEIAITIGSILAVVATVLAYIFIIPENKRAGLNKLLQWVHDVCNFKLLYIEHILKALYILETAFCLIAGFLMLFSVIDAYFFTVYIGWVGLIVMIVGPIITRLIYEALMLAVLHLKATREINDKLVIQPGSVAEQKEKERIKAEQEAAERARLAQQQQLAQQQYQQQIAQQQIAQQQYQQQFGQPQYPAQPYQQPQPIPGQQPIPQPQQVQEQQQPQAQEQPQAQAQEQAQVQEQAQEQVQAQEQLQNDQN